MKCRVKVDKAKIKFEYRSGGLYEVGKPNLLGEWDTNETEEGDVFRFVPSGF